MEAPGDAPAVFPFGMIGFTVGELTGGATVTVALTMPGTIPEGAVYYKYQNGVYTRYDSVTGLDYGGSSFTITVTDGGAGDADGEVNGLIVDPGGLGLLTNLYFPHIDTNSPWGTEIALINTSAGQSVSGTLKAYSNTGQLIDTMAITLGPHGRRQLTIADELTNHTNIGYIIFDTDAGTVQGYTKFYVSGQYRVAVPAVKEINTGDIYISHIDSSTEWWTGVSLLNTTDSSKTLTVTFDTGQTKTLTLAAKEHQAFTIAGLFDGQSQPDIHSGVITNANGVVGLELFGSGNQMSGILLKDDTASTLYYPHIASDNTYWTGIVAYNPASSSATLTITPYTEGGTSLTTQTLEILAGGKYIGTVSGLSLPSGTAWFKIEATSPITGFELFGTTNGNQLAGYTGVGISGKEGIFAKIEKNSGWTGIAFVNIEESQASITLTAYDDNGTPVATQMLSLGSYEKEVRLAGDFFSQNIDSATYITYSSDRELVGFQLNGSSDGMMLDGLPGLGARKLTYPIVDTGQSKCYDNTSTINAPQSGQAFYGQDAQHTGNMPCFTDNGDGTVTDHVTGLMWQKSPDTDTDGDIDADDKLSYDQAVAKASTLNLGGYTDWRLPSIKELYSLIDFRGTDPSGYSGADTSGLIPFIDSAYFDFAYGDTSAGERIIDAQYASSTLYVSNTANDGGRTMFGVNFADGRIKGYGLTLFGSDKTFFVIYVRGNASYGKNKFANNYDGIITDYATGLMWPQDDSGMGLNWEEALAWVEQKNDENYLGYSDWRLPNAKELQSIVDYTRSPDTTGSAGIDPLFKVTPIINEAGQSDYPCYWSSTTHGNWTASPGANGVYVAFGRTMGYMNNTWIDVHGAGAQRSDPKSGDPADYPFGRGPQGDAIRIYNYIRPVRDADFETVGNEPAFTIDKTLS
jgi:archaellum component FlaF (FlaF/FlaG flagellin family)